MNDRHWVEAFTPVGDRLCAQKTITRRSFIGASMSLPAAPLLLGTSASRGVTTTSVNCETTLRFDEDKDGMTITWYPALEVDQQRKDGKQINCVPTFEDEKQAKTDKTRTDIEATQARSWRIVRNAFGPGAKFRLRRDANRPEFILALEIENVRFGELDPSSHVFTFTHDSKTPHWHVSLSTRQWHSGRLLTCQKKIPFEQLSQLVSSEAPPTAIDFKVDPIPADREPEGCFWIDTDADVLRKALGFILENHVRVEGPLRLMLAKNGVWFLVPRKKGGTGTPGRILLAQDALLAHQGISMAWCDPPSDDSTEAAGDARKVKRTENDPVFMAWGNMQASAKQVVLGDSRHSHVTLVAMPILAEPATLSTPSPPSPPPATGKPAASTCASDAKPAPFERTDGSNAFVKDHQSILSFPPQWRYLRRDWSYRNQHPAGVSTVRAAWLANANLCVSGHLTEFGPLCIREGALQQSRAIEPQLRFAGRLDSNPWWLKSRIGWLRAQGWSVDAAGIDPAQASARTHHPLMTAASDGFGTALSSLDVPMLLSESELAPTGCDFSKLTFAPTGLRAVYASDARKARADLRVSDSYLWLGNESDLGDLPLAHIDLTQARIEVARTLDLARLAFMFAGLHLDIVRGAAWITDTRSSCRVRRRVEPGRESDPMMLDARPVLVVEFPPQHVFEEAIFRPGVAPLPDVALKEQQVFRVKLPVKQEGDKEPNEQDREFSTSLPKLLRQLDELEAADDRIKVRKAYADLKVVEQKNSTSPAYDPSAPFEKFSKRFEELFSKSDKAKRWPAEQRIYIGALNLPADLAAEARKVNDALRKDVIASLLERTLDEANRLVELLNKQEPSLNSTTRWFWQKVYEYVPALDPANKTTHPLPPRDKARLIEQAVSGVMQSYSDYRDFYAEQMVLRQSQKSFLPDDMEFFSLTNRKNLKFSEGYPIDDIGKAYLAVLEGTQDPAQVMRARLSGISRLAFHVDCGSRPGVDVEDGDAHVLSGRSRSRRSGASNGTRLPFSFDALTDWGHYDLAVTPRARQAAAFDDSGVLIRRDISESGLEEDSAGADVSMLKSLGIRSGQVVTRPQGPGRSRDWGRSLRTIQERLADVEASLRMVPDDLQTAIELPARLILSPSQKAQWRTPRRWCPDSSRPVPLWSATLDTDAANPLVRAVASPDMRPEFVRLGLERKLVAVTGGAGSSLHSPVGSGPPRGPRAPWTLGFEENDPNISPIEDLFVAASPDGTPRPALGSVCGPSPSASAATPAPTSPAASAADKPELHQVVEYLCRRQDERAGYKKHALFRSTLDAYDRHEIVLLSSAWGLPVRGRREKSGELQALRVSSQVELPPEWRLLDAQAGTAMYRPRALKVRELTLTALGGSLRHDSDFVPPSAARHIIHGPLFDSMSVERWQHWTVLGRDVFAEVVYKGYLFPIGHRASLVKQTERVFIRPVGGGQVRAYLRQRMFIRVARPDKSFPAYGQPHGGRKFPGGVVSMLTVTTPDIVDPTEDTRKLDGPAPSGRLFADQAGLVFWPRTARLNGAEVAFDIQIQGAATRAKLMFVDNVAVNRAELLDQLVAYYNRLPSPDLDQTQNNQVDIKALQPLLHLRSLDMRGQSLRYCDEVKPGSASHKTLAWTLKATGCAGVTSYLNKRSAQINPWEGLVERYDDPMLEGADQPPFFPAIETARIRIDQVERLTNGTPQAAIAQFDGWYIKNGFEPDRISREKDALEIYVDIVNSVTMDMGSSGDRSGGVMRPAGQVIALSRQRGPLTGTNAAVRSAGTTGTVTGTSGYPVTLPEPRNMQPLVGGAKSAPEQLDGARRAFEQFFSSATDALDTRILGLVSLKELVQFLNISDAASDLPRLREAVEYGLGGVDAGVQVVRTQVIVPLHNVVKELDEQWRKAGADAVGNLPGFVGGMEDVFPDVDRALNDLLKVLGQAVTSTEDTAVFASLGDVYECGRRLMDACGRVAANPLDHLQLAVKKRLQGLADGIERFSEELERLKVNELTAPLVASLVSSETVQQLLGGAFDWFASLAGSLNELHKKVKDQEPVLAAFHLTLSRLKSPPPVMDQLRNAIVSAFASKDIPPPLQEAAKIVGERLDAVQSWLDAARTPLDNLPAPEKQDEATGAVSTALEFFEAARTRVSQAKKALKDVEKIDGSEYRQSVHALSDILQIAATVNQIAGDRKAVLALFSQAVSEYLALLVGPRLAKLPSLNDVKSFARKVLDPIKDVADSALQSIADPLKPANPKPTPSTNGDFTIPKGWLVPGKGSSLVDRFHDIAKAAQAALERAKKATNKEEMLDPPSRDALAKLGDDALDAERVLHRAAISLRIAANAMADVDESRLQSAMHQADAASEALSRLGEDIASTLQRLVKDLLALEIDLKIIGPVVTPARDLVERSLRWLSERSKDLKKRLEEISEVHTPWKQVLQPWSDLSGQYSDRITKAADAALDNSNAQWLKLRNGILPDLSDLPAPAGAAKASSAAAVTTLERLAVQQVMAWASSLAAPTQAATNALVAAFRPAVTPVSDAYAKLLEARNLAYAATIGTPAEWVNDALLVRADPALVFVPDTLPDKINAGTKTDNDQLHWDTQSLRHLVALKESSSDANRSRAVRFLDHLVQGWRTGQSSPLRIARQVQQISLEEVRAKLMALINFSAIREEIEERIKLLIPAGVTLSYDFSTSIGSAAGGSLDKANVFRPKEGCALSIKTRAKINLLETGKPSFQSMGEMGAFDIQLLGSFDALTLHFKGVRFVSQGGTPDCDLQYDGFTIGPQLKFLEQLTPFFGSKPGSGFYLKPLDTGIGLEAGYGLNLGTFSIGNLAIFNVSLNAAARLPFDNRNATFVASLSRRDSPFTIAIAPYGGSGFFALEADTKGIVGFEASFEYGGAAAFAYGPLTGQGRLMVGAYIRSSRNSTRIFATFYVGGSASIWIFSFGASLYVNAEQKGSSMVGSATYTFSFSMGIVDYDYKVAVNVNLNLDGSSGNKDSKSAMADADPPVRLASIDPGAWNPDTTTSDVPLHFVSLEPSRKHAARAKATTHRQGVRKVDTICPSTNWAEYSKYFDLGLKVRMEDY